MKTKRSRKSTSTSWSIPVTVVLVSAAVGLAVYGCQSAQARNADQGVQAVSAAHDAVKAPAAPAAPGLPVPVPSAPTSPVQAPAVPTAQAPSVPDVPVAPVSKWVQVVADDPAAKVYALTIGAERQTFHGFGSSALDCSQWTDHTPRELHHELAQQMWGDGGLHIMRVWLFTQDTFKPDGSVDLHDFKTRYIDSHVIEEAQAAGCTTLELVPACMPPHLRLQTPEAQTTAGGHNESKVISDANVTKMMVDTAEVISQVKKLYKVTINVAGIMNEPNQDSGFSGFISTAQTPLAVKALRKALDERGLKDVGVIAPETSSVDWTFDDRINALRADPKAWSAVNAVAWHSYNMAMVPHWGDEILPTGKDMWMTEASANGSEQPNDRIAAAAMAARIANDLRSGCTHWLWFLAYEGHDQGDDQTRLIRIFQDQSPVKYEILGKFHPLKDLCAAFPPGSTMLATKSDPAFSPWTYGRKPALQAVAAKRPDGAISIAAVDFTDASFPAADAKGSFEVENAGFPAETQRLDWTLPIAEGTARVRRRDAELATAIDEVLPVHGGKLSLTLRPLEIVTVVVTPDVATPAKN